MNVKRFPFGIIRSVKQTKNTFINVWNSIRFFVLVFLLLRELLKESIMEKDLVFPMIEGQYSFEIDDNSVDKIKIPYLYIFFAVSKVIFLWVKWSVHWS